MAVQQLVCQETQRLRASASLRVVQVPVEDLQLLCDASTGVLRPLVPVNLRRRVFEAIHGIAHPGVRATRRLISARYVWRGLSSEVNRWTSECLHCQRAKTARHVRLRPELVPVPSRRFAHIHVDLVGPLPPSAGFSYLFTVVDRSTRWPEAYPLADTSAFGCASALFHGWVSRFGVPGTITSDRGPQFTSAVWSSLCTLLGVKHAPTTAFHPQANGLVERFHRRLKDALRARLAGPDWFHHLPWVLLGLRAAPREDSASSAAGAVYGSELVLPGQFLEAPEDPSPRFLEDLTSAMRGFVPVPVRHNSASASVPVELPPALVSAEMVLVRRDGHKPPLSPAYDGPYKVLARSPKFFRLQLGDRADSVSVERLKPARCEPGVPAAPPRRRGRPRRLPPPRAPDAPPRRPRGRPPRDPAPPPSTSAASGPVPASSGILRSAPDLLGSGPARYLPPRRVRFLVQDEFVPD